MKGKVDPLHLSELITFLRHSHSLFVCHGQPFTRHPRPSVVTPSVVRREPARSTLRLSGSVTLHPRSSGSVSLSGLFTSTSGSGASPEGGDPRRIEDKIDSVPFLLSLHLSSSSFTVLRSPCSRRSLGVSVPSPPSVPSFTRPGGDCKEPEERTMSGGMEENAKGR